RAYTNGESASMISGYFESAACTMATSCRRASAMKSSVAKSACLTSMACRRRPPLEPLRPQAKECLHLRRIELLRRRKLPVDRAELLAQMHHAAAEEPHDRIPGIGKHATMRGIPRPGRSQGQRDRHLAARLCATGNSRRVRADRHGGAR